MKDIVKEIVDAEASGELKNKEAYFRKETMIAREYFNNEILMRYPNLEFIRIFMKKTTFIPTFHETMRDEEYYLYSVFIDKNTLQYMSSENLVRSLNGEKVIDLSRSRWNEQVQLRNKFFKACPIIMAECSYYYDNSELMLSNINMKLTKNISIYPYNYKITDYALLNSTNYILISNSEFLSQKELDNLCLEILRKLSNENQEVIISEKAIYLSISDKLKRNRILSLDERKVLEQFINNEMSIIDTRNTLLVRSMKKEG